MNNYTALFDGYWRECNKSSIPKKQGVYLVYTCKFNVEEKTVSLKKLIYIGKAEDVNNRLANHEKLSEFKKQCEPDETNCYSFAPVEDEQDLSVIENALIFAQKPILNSELVNEFKYGDSSFDFSGKCSMLEYTQYTIKKSK